ncbi:hypothetical protein GOBAR_DD02948 [Gossypium barbadense]|nr:hypothetical protein GOBAR_DD02948 [Gossypium barbadense]
MAEVNKQKHFILVHGACHGAWCWYKLKPRLESAGHRVTAVNMAASGINMKAIQGVHSMYEYSKPLLEILASLAPGEKAILVGHSLGGLNLALAMEKYPENISAAVFLAAFMPDTAHHPSFVLEQDLELAKALIRPGSMFLSDLSKADKFSKEKFGSVPRVYVVCKEDKGIPEEFQRWMIQNSEVNEVMEIKDADHMAMFSKPHKLFNTLSEIGHKYG